MISLSLSTIANFFSSILVILTSSLAVPSGERIRVCLPSVSLISQVTFLPVLAVDVAEPSALKVKIIGFFLAD
jgi:hypothetical protein